MRIATGGSDEPWLHLIGYREVCTSSLRRSRSATSASISWSSRSRPVAASSITNRPALVDHHCQLWPNLRRNRPGQPQVDDEIAGHLTLTVTPARRAGPITTSRTDGRMIVAGLPSPRPFDSRDGRPFPGEPVGRLPVWDETGDAVQHLARRISPTRRTEPEWPHRF